MATSKFPTFAPTSLIEKHNRLLNHLKSNDQLMGTAKEDIQREVAVINKLCTHPNMETVWRRIKKRKLKKYSYSFTLVLSEKSRNWSRRNHLETDICSSYASAIYKYLKRDKFSYLPVSERFKKGQQLIDSMNLLANDLERFDIGKSVFKYLDCGSLLRSFNRIEDTERDNLYDNLLAKVLSLPHSRSISDILRDCSKDLESEKPYENIPISHVNSVSADAVYFVRKLCKWNMEHFGFALYDITAITADVFYPDLNFDEKKVMNTLK